MKENAKIKITTLTEPFDGSPSDKFELETLGSFYKKDGKFYIVYEETELTGFKDTTTTIKFMSDAVSLIRHGAASGRMEFVKNGKRLCNYNTPYGAIPVATELRELSHSFSKNGGKAKIRYILDYNNETIAQNTLDISVEMKG